MRPDVHMIRLARAFPVGLSIVVLLLTDRVPAQTRRYSADEIVKLLRSGVTETRVVALVLDGCVANGGSEATQRALRVAGASGSLLRFASRYACAPEASRGSATARISGRSEYLVCQTCHQENGEGLPNLYPPLAGSEWLTGNPDIPIAIVLHGLQGEITVRGMPFNNVMAPWASLSDAQIAAILTYERSSWGNSAPPVTARQVSAVRARTASRTNPWTIEELLAAYPALPVGEGNGTRLDGRAEYLLCQTCHQENGEGLPNLYPPLAGSEWLTGDPELPIAVVLHGMQGEVSVRGATFNNVMAPWASLSNAQIAAILTYARSSWGNRASTVTTQQVAAVRAKTAWRKTPWTPDEVLDVFPPR